MRQALQALTDELRRLRTAGVRTVAVSDTSLAALKRIVEASANAAITESQTGSVTPDGDRPVVSSAPSLANYIPPLASRPTVRKPEPLPGTPIPSLSPVVSLPTGDKATRWAALKEMVLNDPTCRAHVRAGKKIVLGVGSLNARIMFVGEAPGAEEEIQGEPFVGPAGQLLTKMIQGMGMMREDVYIGNIMNWRPEMPVSNSGHQVGNRPPTEEEMRYCLPYLKAQIEVVNPEVLVALGATAAQGLLGFGSFKALGEIRGKWHEFSGKPLMVTYHPSYILRNQSNRSKRMIWEDLLKVMERVGLTISERQRNFFLEK